MASATRKQDMPPPGGYKNINFERLPAKTYFKGPTILLGFVGISIGSILIFYRSYKQLMRERIEIRSSMVALTPLLLAERDREFLKQLRHNRDEEAKLMANVPDWKVGTYYGEPIYKTVDKDALIEPSIKEYYVHTEVKYLEECAENKFWT